MCDGADHDGKFPKLRTLAISRFAKSSLSSKAGKHRRALRRLYAYQTKNFRSKIHSDIEVQTSQGHANLNFIRGKLFSFSVR